MLEEPTLLVVDDEEVVCEGCRRIFSGRGFQVEESTDARKGLNLATENDYSAILLDIKMPDMNGIQFLEQLRGKKPDVPVIVVTGYPSILSATSATRLGASGYVTKPFTPDQIIQAVEKSLASRKAKPLVEAKPEEPAPKAVSLQKIAVVLRQVPDPIEGLEIAESGTSLDMDEISFIVNETDQHALEQALLLKAAVGATVTVVSLDFGEVDDTLYTAAARGADQIVKIPFEQGVPPSPRAAASMFAQVIKGIEPELVLVGVQADDELEGLLAPQLASELKLPYLGVIRGVQPTDDATAVRAFKELGGAVKAQMSVRLPALLGILAAEERPQYVSVSRIRAAMKSTKFQERSVSLPTTKPATTLQRLYCPEVAERAEILEGSEDEVAARLVEILVEKGIVK